MPVGRLTTHLNADTLAYGLSLQEMPILITKHIGIMSSSKMTNREEMLVGIKNIGQLVTAIEKANDYFQGQVQRQVNTALTLRNWFIGQYIVEYEQKGEDRAGYGEELLKQIAIELNTMGLKSLGERNLYLCKQFYLAYPYISHTPSAKSYLTDFESLKISQAVYAKSDSKEEEQSKIG